MRDSDTECRYQHTVRSLAVPKLHFFFTENLLNLHLVHHLCVRNLENVVKAFLPTRTNIFL